MRSLRRHRTLLSLMSVAAVISVRCNATLGGSHVTSTKQGDALSYAG